MLGYLTGPEAVDVARMTGLQLRSNLHKAWEPSDISPHAIPEGARATDHIYLDLSRLDWWDRFRVFWCRLGGHYFLQPAMRAVRRGKGANAW